VIKLIYALLVLCGVCFAPILYAETPVEITLVDKLDEPRGFCIDTIGYKHRARPERGLHTHSCYSYEGALAVDQAFDADLIRRGTFKILGFNLCMTARTLSPGSGFALEPCDGRETQQFEHRPNGQIVQRTLSVQCVTVGEGPSREGGGGNPVHLIRDLILDPCDGSRNDRQKWRLRETAD